MDDFGGIAILVVIWIVGALFDKKRKQERRRKQKASPRPPPSIEVESVTAEPRPRLPDASQREGSKLEQVLRQLNPELADLADQALSQSRQDQPTQRKPKRLPAALQPSAEPVAVAPQGEDDFLAKAERAIAQRRMAAEEHSSERVAQDHATFHQAVRRTGEPKAEAVRAAEAPSLEQAIIWREILGPPKALTIDEM